MEQNNFEKNIQQKLDELKIPPSDSVWINVEKRIGKKKKDRKVIFIFFFLILFLLSGGYWLFISTKNNAVQSDQFSKLKEDSKPTNNGDSSFGKFKITSGINHGNTGSASISERKIKRFKVDSQNNIENENEKKLKKLIDGFTSKSKKNYAKGTNNEDSEIALNIVSKLIEKKTDIAEIENKKESENIESNIQNQISTDSFSNELKTEKTIEEFVTKKDSSTKKTSKKQQWIFGITFSGGSSLIGSNILERNYPSADVNAGVPQGGIPSYYYSASPIKNSTAFIAGVFIEKNISNKNKISLGFSYKYFSLLNKVGNKIDSLISSPQSFSSFNNIYSSVNNVNIYRNNFHYLEIPVSIKLNLNNNKSVPLFWLAGINISQLISSNALQYKSNLGIYYSDNSLFNKTQIGLQTGLEVIFFFKKKNPLTVGPYFSYNLSSLATKGLYDKKHFSFIGIHTEILFKKK